MHLLKLSLRRCGFRVYCLAALGQTSASPQRISTTSGFKKALLTGAGNCMVAAAPAQAGAAAPPECAQEPLVDKYLIVFLQQISSGRKISTDWYTDCTFTKKSKEIFLLMLVESLPVGIVGGMFGGIHGGIGGPPGAFVVSPTHLNFKHDEPFRELML